MALSRCKILSTGPLDLKEAKWIGVQKLTYTDPTGTPRTWESAHRLTRPSDSAIDAVSIVAILHNDPDGSAADGPRILLQKQYRPPADAVAIEVPAGLLDKAESAEQCALRELREETGYVGEVMRDGDGFGVGPVMFNDPGFCSTNLRMVHVRIDLSREENRDPRPNLEDGEFIECFAVPLKGLYRECVRLEEMGYAIDARVGTLAEGVEFARRCGLQ